MKYDHELWDCMLKILKFGKERLEARGNAIMSFEVDKIYQNAINDFSIPLNQLAWALGFICKEPEVLPTIGQDNFDKDEKKAIECKDLQATSRKAGIESVRIAHERLTEEDRLKPVSAAQLKLEQAKKAVEEKKAAAEAAQAERDRPTREVKQAEQEAEQAEAELKKAEKLVDEEAALKADAERIKVAADKALKDAKAKPKKAEKKS